MPAPIRPAILAVPKPWHPTYMPALMLKGAETVALRSLNGSERRMYPLLRVIPIKPARTVIDEKTGEKKIRPALSREEHVANQVDHINRIFELSFLRCVERAILDVSRLDTQGGKSTLVDFDRVLTNGVKRDLVPLLWAEQSKEHAAAAQDWNERFQTGHALRLGRQDNRHGIGTIPLRKDAALRAMRQAGGIPAKTDLIIDLGFIGSTRSDQCVEIAEGLLRDLAARSKWRTVTILGGAFPRSIGDLEPNLLHKIPRTEFAIWEEVRSRLGKILPDITFGDYAMVHAVPPTGGTSPMPNLRYTIDRDWIVLRRPDDEAMKVICNVMTSEPWYRGKEFSKGDEWMYGAARRSDNNGNGQIWIQTGLQHHLSHVLDQLPAN